MKSTTSLRPARPPFALMYFAAPFTPATEPAKKPGTSGFSTSATTAMRISFGLTPTSVLCRPPPELVPACATPGSRIVMMTAVMTIRICRMVFRAPLE